MRFYTQGVFTWSEKLPHGTEIVVSGSSYNVAQNSVQDNGTCSDINKVISIQGSETVIVPFGLRVRYDFVPTESVSYRLTAAPRQGELQLSNASLAAGDSFDSSHLLGSQLIYASSALAATDSFTYTARATFRASINSLGEQAIDHLANAPTPAIRGGADEPSISANGSAVAFTFEGVNLFRPNGSVVPVPDASTPHVYQHTLQSDGRTTEAVSVSSSRDVLGNNDLFQPSILWDGTAVAFASRASNLLPDDGSACANDTNSELDIFVNRFGLITRHSAFFTGGNCEPMSGSSSIPAIGGDNGKYVVAHTSTVLTPTVDSDVNSGNDVFLNYQAQATSAQSTLRTSTGDIATGDGGSYNADISDNGRYVTFETDATYLGEGIALADTNGERDIMLRPVVDPSATDTFTSAFRISLTSNNEQAVGGGSFRPAISRFGNHIAFDSEATNLMTAHNGVGHIYVRDQQVREDGERGQPCTVPLSFNGAGEPGNADSHSASISADGRFVAFQSEATNLVEGDTNGVSDIFVVDRDADGDYSFYGDSPGDIENCVPGPRRLFRISIASDGTQANGASSEPDISGNGDFVAFTSAATNVVADDTNGIDDVFVHYIGFTGEVRFQREWRAYLPLIQ